MFILAYYIFIILCCYDAIFVKKKKKLTLFDLITAHTPISVQSSNLVVFRLQPLYLYPLFYKSICCGYSFELPRQFKLVTTAYAFIKTMGKKNCIIIVNNPLVTSSAKLSLKCALIRCIFY